MKSTNGAKTPQLPSGDDTFEQISTVIILDTFILALFSLVMLATALVSITTHNSLSKSTSSSNSDRGQNPTNTVAVVENRFLRGRSRAEKFSKSVSVVHKGSISGSLPQNFLGESDIFTFQKPAPMRLFGRPSTTQVGTLEKFMGAVRGGRVGSPERVLREPATPTSVEIEIKDSPATGGPDPWNAGDFYDGYGISTIINNL